MSKKSVPAGLERRKEDDGLITGLARYVDDLKLAKGRPPALYMAFVRSPYAHAEIKGIQFDAAQLLLSV
jgi:aerobic carbon-monoxide dehydrogenase large subunit